jgi:membrane protease YdiL (CAAX protease family)
LENVSGRDAGFVVAATGGLVALRPQGRVCKTRPKPLLNVQKLAQPGFWMAVLLVLIGLGVQMALAIPVAIVDVVLKEFLHQPLLNLGRHALVIGCINLMSFGTAIAVGLFLNRLSFRKAFPFTRFTLAQLTVMMVLVLGIGIGLSEVDNAFRALLPPPQWLAGWMHDAFFHEDRLFSSIFLLIIVAPLTEELLFRGIILRGLLSRFRPWTAVLLTAFLFAANHLNPWQFFSALILGCVLGWFYVRTGSIVFCVLAHAFANSLGLLSRALPWSIPGMTGDDLTVVEFQPWWLDLSALALILVGLWAFRKVTPCPTVTEVPAPPVIMPGGTLAP